MYVIFSSFGNDSIALIRWAFEYGLKNVTVVYNNTGWSKPSWRKDRVIPGKALIAKYGFKFHETKSIGFVALAQMKMAFPREGMQFCTEHLKILPSLAWLSEVDPNLEAICLVGVRREESAKRSTFPEHVEESDKHGGRSLWAPLVRHTVEMRDELILATGFTKLAHRSQECYPCVNSNRADLRQLDETRIIYIEKLEKDMGVGKKSGKPKTFFRPKRHQGAVGIRNVMQWANDGHYIEGQQDLFDSGCNSGFCD